MSIENKKTLDVYKNTAHTYLLNNIENDKLDPVKTQKKREKLQKFIEISLKDIPDNSKVFEIGSRDGSEAKYISSLGYNITASDTTEEFINAIKSKNLKVINFNVLEDDFPEKFFAIFCWRVFVHFTKDDALKVIKKAYANLEKNGLFIFNAINRETKLVDNEWLDLEKYPMGAKRYYNYFLKNELDDMIHKTNFQIQHFHTEGGKSNNKWLVYVLKK